MERDPNNFTCIQKIEHDRFFEMDKSQKIINIYIQLINELKRDVEVCKKEKYEEYIKKVTEVQENREKLEKNRRIRKLEEQRRFYEQAKKIERDSIVEKEKDKSILIPRSISMQTMLLSRSVDNKKYWIFVGEHKDEYYFINHPYNIEMKYYDKRDFSFLFESYFKELQNVKHADGVMLGKIIAKTVYSPYTSHMNSWYKFISKNRDEKQEKKMMKIWINDTSNKRYMVLAFFLGKKLNNPWLELSLCEFFSLFSSFVFINNILTQHKNEQISKLHNNIKKFLVFYMAKYLSVSMIGEMVKYFEVYPNENMKQILSFLKVTLGWTKEKKEKDFYDINDEEHLKGNILEILIKEKYFLENKKIILVIKKTSDLYKKYNEENEKNRNGNIRIENIQIKYSLRENSLLKRSRQQEIPSSITTIKFQVYKQQKKNIIPRTYVGYEFSYEQWEEKEKSIVEFIGSGIATRSYDEKFTLNIILQNGFIVKNIMEALNNKYSISGNNNREFNDDIFINIVYNVLKYNSLYKDMNIDWLPAFIRYPVVTGKNIINDKNVINFWLDILKKKEINNKNNTFNGIFIINFIKNMIGGLDGIIIISSFLVQYFGVYPSISFTNDKKVKKKNE